MLINITNDLCVKKLSSKLHTQWACYIPELEPNNHKRCLWKKVSGIMSTLDMKQWLKKEYPENSHSEVFSDICLPV